MIYKDTSQTILYNLDNPMDVYTHTCRYLNGEDRSSGAWISVAASSVKLNQCGATKNKLTLHKP